MEKNELFAAMVEFLGNMTFLREEMEKRFEIVFSDMINYQFPVEKVVTLNKMQLIENNYDKVERAMVIYGQKSHVVAYIFFHDRKFQFVLSLNVKTKRTKAFELLQIAGGNNPAMAKRLFSGTCKPNLARLDRDWGDCDYESANPNSRLSKIKP